MDRDIIHETIVRDIVDIVSDVKDFDEVQFLTAKKDFRSFKSITSATKDLILTFPVVCSTDMDISTVTMVSKALEKKCAALLQILFTAVSMTDAYDSAADYVKSFHTNIRLDNDMTIDSFIDTMDRLVELGESGPIEITNKELYDAIKEDLRHSFYTLPDSISENGINDYKFMPKNFQYCNENTVVLEDSKKNGSKNNGGKNNSGRSNPRNTSNITVNIPGITGNVPADALDSLYDRMDDLRTEIRRSRDSRTSAGFNSSRDEIQRAKDVAEIQKANSERISKMILPTEWKKANEAMPTLMQVNFIAKGRDGAPDMLQSIVIGVKCKLYPVDTMDIINRIKTKVVDKNVLNKFIRATTNEISFFKDFLFAIDKAKLDAVSTGSRKGNSSRLWKVLERRALKSKIRRSMRMSNDASAITNLLVSAEVVEYLKKNDNIDLYNLSTARQLLESYNLMSIEVADETLEVCKFLFDTGDDMYETLSFNNLEREASDGSYKKVINLMTKNMQR